MKPTEWKLSSTGANDGRLSPVSSYNHNLVSACRVITHTLVFVNGRTLEHMAGDSDADKWSITGRCMAMLFNAVKSSRAAMGEHCTISQTYPVALLFAYGANVKAA
jgi:hypothetical protein